MHAEARGCHEEECGFGQVRRCSSLPNLAPPPTHTPHSPVTQPSFAAPSRLLSTQCGRRMTVRDRLFTGMKTRLSLLATARVGTSTVGVGDQGHPAALWGDEGDAGTTPAGGCDDESCQDLLLHRWPEALALQALPENLPAAMYTVGTICDELLYWAEERTYTSDASQQSSSGPSTPAEGDGDRGDMATWLAKRAGLAGVYGSSELVLISDVADTPFHSATWRHLGTALDTAIEGGETLSRLSSEVTVGKSGEKGSDSLTPLLALTLQNGLQSLAHGFGKHLADLGRHRERQQ